MRPQLCKHHVLSDTFFADLKYHLTKLSPTAECPPVFSLLHPTFWGHPGPPGLHSKLSLLLWCHLLQASLGPCPCPLPVSPAALLSRKAGSTPGIPLLTSHVWVECLAHSMGSQHILSKTQSFPHPFLPACGGDTLLAKTRKQCLGFPCIVNINRNYIPFHHPHLEDS